MSPDRRIYCAQEWLRHTLTSRRTRLALQRALSLSRAECRPSAGRQPREARWWVSGPRDLPPSAAAQPYPVGRGGLFGGNLAKTPVIRKGTSWTSRAWSGMWPSLAPGEETPPFRGGHALEVHRAAQAFLLAAWPLPELGMVAVEVAVGRMLDADDMPDVGPAQFGNR